MRVFLAAIFVFVGMMAAVILLGLFGWFERIPLLLVSAGLALYFLILCVVALVLFNSFQREPSPGAAFDALGRLEAAGLLLDTTYEAIRAFQVEEVEDEGAHYFIELQDKSVLYLTGQYLYDYGRPYYSQENDDEDHDGKNWNYDEDDLTHEILQPFPCTKFTVRRHKVEGWVATIDCRGEYLEPESLEPAFSQDLFDRDWVPQDGDIITDQTYDEVKQTVHSGRTPTR